MTEKKYTGIPRRLKSISKDDPYVATSGDIVDETLGKSQEELNSEMKSITDQMVIAIDGGSVELTGDPDDIVEGGGKVPNANAVARKIRQAIPEVEQDIVEDSPNAVSGGAVYAALEEKQETLESGTNIKTINGESILGEGNIEIPGGGGGGSVNSVNGKTGDVELNAEDVGAVSEEQVTQLLGGIFDSILSSQLYKETLSYTSKQAGRVIYTNGNTGYVGSIGYVAKYNIAGYTNILVSGRLGSSEGRCLYCFYDSNDTFISYGVEGSSSTAGTYTDLAVAVPQGAAIIRVQGNDENGPAAVKGVTDKTVSEKIKEVESLGYLYRGIAIPSTNPNQINGKVFYIATVAGTYTNFSSLVVSEGINILKYDGTSWSLEIVVGIDDDIKEENTGLAKSSEVYKFVHDLIDEEENVTVQLPYTSNQTGRVIKTDGTISTVGSSYVATYNISDYNNILVSGRVGSISGRCLYCFYDSNDTFISYGVEGSSSTAGTYTDLSVEVPQGALTIKVQGNDDNGPAAVKVTVAASNAVIHPLLRYETIETSTGDFSNTYNGKQYLSTPRFIKLSKKDIRIKSKNNVNLIVFKYAFDFSFISYSSYTLTANTPLDLNFDGVKYIKLMLSNTTSGNDVPLQEIEVSSQKFDADWDTFNPISADNGYHRIVVNVNVTNPNCCDTITNNVQDSESLYPDYGVIALPSQYVNRGKPTRLIIYCHGAAVNYSSSVTRFNSTDLEPDYWLSEGYAVMDVEGNPFNNADEHAGIPQAQDCYVAAYKWAIEHYNIRQDGVFLGGRSMGGLNTLNLISPECPIPVIAACPNVPVVTPVWWWQYMNAERRAFAALHMGFEGTAPTWTSGSTLSADEWQYLKDNFVKWAKYSPLLRLIPNAIIDKSVFLNDDFNSITASVRLAKTQEVFNNLSIKVKVPVKLFAATNDSGVTPSYNSVILQKMLENGANIAETRWFDSTLHHYDTQEDALRTTIINSYGIEMQNISVVYIEMLEFWKRYEQLN